MTPQQAGFKIHDAELSYRAIRVEARRKGLTVRAKAGYFAPTEQ